MVLYISTRDVGLTQVATIWIGDTPIVEFYTSTKHEDTSIVHAEAIVAKALKPLFDAAIEEHEYCRPWMGEAGGTHY